MFFTIKSNTLASMPARRRRTVVPPDVGARVLFDSDRTCCVCRLAGKPIQLHHVNGDPTNHDPANIAALCLECHNLTQLKGGFDRKLDADQVILYRDDWYLRVARRREVHAGRAMNTGPPLPESSEDVELVTTLAELHRERENWWDLALLYHGIGNDELRDKYLDEALGTHPRDDLLIRARRLQGRLPEIPPEVVERHLEEVRTDPVRGWTYLYDLLTELGRPLEAAKVFADGIRESLEDDRPFTAAYYLKRTFSLVEGLFRESLRRASENDDLWWQVRPLQELGWTSALAELLEENAERIRDSDDLLLQRLLADYEGDTERIRELELELAEDTVSAYIKTGSEEADDEPAPPTDPPA